LPTPAGANAQSGGAIQWPTEVTMPRDGALTLADLRAPKLTIVCEPCGRHGTYNVARLVEQHGDAKLTDLLQTLANCPKARSAIHDRCKAVFEGLAV
jgi:hypothetical protein